MRVGLDEGRPYPDPLPARDKGLVWRAIREGTVEREIPPGVGMTMTDAVWKSSLGCPHPNALLAMGEGTARQAIREW
jgi:hypothetical protein